MTKEGQDQGVKRPREAGWTFRAEGKGSRFILPSLLLLALIFFAVPWPGILYGLQVAHLPKGRILLTLPFVLRHSFSISYTHSIYLAPVEEKFEVQETQIHLREISTNSWGVVEYYGLPGLAGQNRGEIRMEGLHSRMDHITMIIGFAGKQKLNWENRTYSLYSLIGPGEKIKIESTPLSPGRYFWEKVKLFSSSSGDDLR